jgi:hypothetical protein
MPADEIRLTVAHELAHFLLHYLWPRETAIQRLGDSIVSVLDGERLPTPVERLSGVLRSVELGPCQHLLERDSVGTADVAATRIEAQADLLAFELLAPASSVLRSSDAGADRRRDLAETYGLPSWAAEAWAGWLDSRSSENPFVLGLRRAARLD